MENLATIAKRRDILQSVAQNLIQKLTLSNKIWIIVTQTQNFSTSKSLFIGLVEDEENSENKWKIDLLGNQTLLSFQIDSGTQANIIPENCFRTLKNKPKLHKPNAKITAYNGSSISVTGPCILNIELKRKTIPILFIVTDVTSQPISTKLNLIK